MISILSFIEYITESEKAEKKGETDSIVNSFYSAIKSADSEENPRGSNKGTEVESLLKGVKASPGDPWCAGRPQCSRAGRARPALGCIDRPGRAR